MPPSIHDLTFSDLVDDNERLRLENADLREANAIQKELLSLALNEVFALTQRVKRFTAILAERR